MTNQAWITVRNRELLAIRQAMKKNQHAATQLARSERAILNRITQLTEQPISCTAGAGPVCECDWCVK